MNRTPSEHPSISCVIPAFNAARYIEEALESVRQQAQAVVEIIVVDDASTDDTADLVAAHDDVVLLRSKTNGGGSSARNIGARKATGELLAFLDADDVWLPHKLETQVAALSEHPEWGAVIALVQTFWEPELADEAERFAGHRIRKPMAAFGGSAIVVKREVFFDCGALDDELRHADFQEWGLRARERGYEVGVVEQVLSRRRIHAGNTSRNQADESNQEFFQMLKRKLDRERGVS